MSLPFPKCPSTETLIAKPPTVEEMDPATLVGQKQLNVAILKAVYTKLKECTDPSYDDLIQAAQIQPQMYQRALRETTSAPIVILQRETCDVNINNYNPDFTEDLERQRGNSIYHQPMGLCHVRSFIHQ